MRPTVLAPRGFGPTWHPRELPRWRAAGGPLHDVGTLDRLRPTAPADGGVVEHGRFTPSAEVDSLAADRASELSGRGARPGDLVVWQAPTCRDSVVLYRACWTLGAVAVPVHHQASAAEVDALVARLPGEERESDGDLGAGQPPEPAPDATTPAVVLHTSGSGGRPKGVVHTHEALAHKARLMVDVHGLGTDDVVLMPAPLAHISGLLNGILVPLAAGMRTVLMERWSPDDALDLIESQGVTFMVGPTTFFWALRHSPAFTADRVASLRLLSLGGAGVTPEFVESTADAFGAVVKRSYGSTEAPTVTTSGPDDDPWTRANTEGRPVGGARIRVVDEHGSPVPANTAGELQVSGPSMFAGYLDAAATAAATVADPDCDWFRTGDLGRIDDVGRLTIVGRLGDVIIRGGENIDPSEIESHLVSHPGIGQAVVVGMPDERLGERICAFVERSGPDAAPVGLPEVQGWFEERGVARMRTPEKVVVMDSLPLLASGKPDRAELRRRAASGTGDSDG